MLLQCRPIAELYPEIVQSYSMQIEQPMDLGTIGEKLDRGEYTVRAGHLAPGFVSDVQLVFLNCMTFNAPGVEVNGFEFHKHAKEMLELFEKESGCESPVFEEPGQATLGVFAGASTAAQPQAWSVDRSNGWSEEECERLRALVQEQGTGSWVLKATMLGTGRTAKAVERKWRMEIGRRGGYPADEPQWSSDEFRLLQHLVDTSGPNSWAQKAAALGTGRSAGSVASKWQRESQRAAEAIGNAWRAASVPPTVSPAPLPGDGNDGRYEDWSKEELTRLRWLVERDGVGRWQQKAKELNTGRTAGAIQVKWSQVKAKEGVARESSGKDWGAEELAKLRWLVQRDGPGQWEQKAVELGTGRTSVALQSRWQVEKGAKQDSRRHHSHNPQQKSPAFRSGGDRSSGGPETTWSGAEITKLAELVRRDGPGRWMEKAAEMGTGRTSAALMNKWYAANRRPFGNGGDHLVMAANRPPRQKAEGAAPVSAAVGSVTPRQPSHPPGQANGGQKPDVGPPRSDWSSEEAAQLQALVAKHGVGDWQTKADTINRQFGANRSANSLKSRWERVTGPKNLRGKPELVMPRQPSRPPPGRANKADGAKGDWTKEESAQLKALVDTHGQGDWEAKATQLGTGRTAKSLERKWERDHASLGEIAADTRAWSAAEFAKLQELVQRDGAGNWASKAAELGTKRSQTSLERKWARETSKGDFQTLQRAPTSPTEKHRAPEEKGGWTEHHDRCLAAIMAVVQPSTEEGNDAISCSWSEIAAAVNVAIEKVDPSSAARSENSCRHRWKRIKGTHKPTLGDQKLARCWLGLSGGSGRPSWAKAAASPKKGEKRKPDSVKTEPADGETGLWTEHEDRCLAAVACVAKPATDKGRAADHGSHSWSEIAAAVSRAIDKVRTENSCRQRYKRIVGVYEPTGKDKKLAKSWLGLSGGKAAASPKKGEKRKSDSVNTELADDEQTTEAACKVCKRQAGFCRYRGQPGHLPTQTPTEPCEKAAYRSWDQAEAGRLEQLVLARKGAAMSVSDWQELAKALGTGRHWMAVRSKCERMRNKARLAPAPKANGTAQRSGSLSPKDAAASPPTKQQKVNNGNEDGQEALKKRKKEASDDTLQPRQPSGPPPPKQPKPTRTGPQRPTHMSLQSLAALPPQPGATRWRKAGSQVPRVGSTLPEGLLQDFVGHFSSQNAANTLRGCKQPCRNFHLCSAGSAKSVRADARCVREIVEEGSVFGLADGAALDADGTAEAVRLSAANKKSSGHQLVRGQMPWLLRKGSLAQLIASCARRPG